MIGDASVRLVGVEAGGEGTDSTRHAATLVAGRPGVLHGAMSYLLQDEHGQVRETHSISAGLDYPGVGPEHSYLKDTGRAEYVAVTDSQALEGFHLLSTAEGIIPSAGTGARRVLREPPCADAARGHGGPDVPERPRGQGRGHGDGSGGVERSLNEAHSHSLPAPSSCSRLVFG